MKKANDWIVAGINNPDFKVLDFADSGLDIKNTQLLSKELYLSSDFIRDSFTDENGKFNEGAFDNFYNLKALEFKLLEESKLEFNYDIFDTSRKPGDKVIKPNFNLYTVANPDRISTGVVARNEEGNRKLSRMELAQQQKIFNPETGLFEDESVNDKALSNSPVKWIKSLFEEPLIMAKYESDGEHYNPLTGLMELHKAGDYKTNKNGTYYTERLNGRSAMGKEFVNVFDTLTVDGEGINKYDFFDSDDLEKSVGGTVMKAAATLVPLFVTGPTASIYGGLMVTREMAKSLPMLYNMFGAWFNLGDSSFLNNLAGIGEKFTQGTSEHAKTSAWNAETMSDLIVNVALQWAQQKAIAEAFNYFKNDAKAVEQAYEKAAGYYLNNTINSLMNPNMNAEKFEELTGISLKVFEEARNVAQGMEALRFTPEGFEKILQALGNQIKSGEWLNTSLGKGALKTLLPAAEKKAQDAFKLGSKMSLAYMAIISNTDTYQDMIERGASKKEAAAVALGSMIGMYAVDSTGLGEIFFNEETRDAEINIRNAMRENKKNWGDYLNKIMHVSEEVAESQTGKLGKLKELINTGIQLGKSSVGTWWDSLKYHTAGVIGKSIGEGVEEVAEDVVSDMAKYTYELLGDLGLPTTLKKVGAFENAGQRYLQSFVGGAVGGGIFYGSDVWRNGFMKRDLNSNISYLIRNGHKQELLDTLEQYREKGKLGSTDLSWNQTAEVTNEDGSKKTIFLTATDSKNTLNEWIYLQIKDAIEQESAIINENSENLDEDALFNLMVLADVRMKRLDKTLQEFGTSAKEQSYTTGYQQYYQQVIDELNRVTEDLRKAKTSKNGLASDETVLTDLEIRNLTPEEQQTRQNNIKLLENRYNELFLLKEMFTSGQLSLEFSRMLRFGMDRKMSEPYFKQNYALFVYEEKHKDVNTLTASELEAYTKEWLQYLKSEKRLRLQDAWRRYKDNYEFSKDSLAEFSEKQEQLRKFQELNEKFFGMEGPLANANFMQESDLFDDELDMSKPLTTIDEDGIELVESIDDYEIRVRVHKQRVQDHNDLEYQRLTEEIKRIVQENGGSLDYVTKSRLLTSIQARLKDFFAEKMGENFNFFVGESLVKYDTLIDEDIDYNNILEIIIDRFRSSLQNEDLDSVKPDVIKDLIREELSTQIAAVRNVPRNLQNARNKELWNMLKYTDESGNTVNVKDGESLGKFIDQQVLLIRDQVKNSPELSAKIDIDAMSDADILEKVVETNDSLSDDEEAEFIPFNVSLSEDSVSFRGTIMPIMDSFYGGEEEEFYTATLQSNLVEAYRNSSMATFGKEIFKEHKSPDFDDIKVEDATEAYLTLVTDTINNELQRILSDPEYKFLLTVQDIHESAKSPIYDLLKKYLLKAGNNDVDKNQTLITLFDKFMDRYNNVKDLSDFSLTESEEKALDELEQYFKEMESVLYATSTLANMIDPVGHNKETNEFVRRHPGIYTDYEDLVTLDPDLANMLSMELNAIRTTFGVKHPVTGKYNPGSWRWMAEQSKLNKDLEFILGELAWNYTVSNFFNALNNSLARYVTVNGTRFDLLKGIEAIPEIKPTQSDGGVYVNKLFDLFKTNWDAALKDSGVSLPEFLRQSMFLEHILTSDVVDMSDSLLQTPSLIDKNIQTLTGYDKLIMLSTILSMRSSDFKRFYNDRVSAEKDVAPLTFLSYCLQQSVSYKRNQYVFDVFSAYLKESLNLDVPLLSGISIITGNGGAGKSAIIAKGLGAFTATYIDASTIDDKIWLSAPEKQQRDNLKVSVGLGTILNLFPDSNSNDSIFSKIFANLKVLTGLLADIKAKKGIKIVNGERVADLDNKSEYYDVYVTAEGNIMTKLTEKTLKAIKKDPKNAPAQIIIDEATNIPPVLIQALSYYSTINRTKDNLLNIALLGDPKQIGHEDTGYNICKEACWGFRTNPLGITLRDCNIQHAYNVNYLARVLNDFLNSKYGTEGYVGISTVISNLANFKPKVYKNGDINGELITPVLSDAIVNSIPKKVLDKSGNERTTTVIYVGKASDDNFTKLKNAGLDVKVFSLEEVQGLEADYAVTNLVPTFANGGSLKDLLALYTIITRGRNGTVLISDSLQNIVGENKVENTQAFAPSIKDSVIKFLLRIKKELKAILDSAPDPEELKFESFTPDKLPDLTFESPDDEEEEDSDEGGDEGGEGPEGGESEGKSEEESSEDESLTQLETEQSIEPELPQGEQPDVLDVSGDSIVYDEKEFNTAIDELLSEDEDLNSESFTPSIAPQEGLLPSFPIRGYSGFHFTGLSLNTSGRSKFYTNDLDYDENNPRDLQLFFKPGETITLEKSLEYGTYLRNMKDFFMFKHDINEFDRLPKMLLAYGIAKENLDPSKVNFFIEVRKANSKEALLYGNGSDSPKAIGDYIYTTVMSIPLKDGRTWNITLGMLADPTVYTRKAGDIIKLNNKYIIKLQALRDGKYRDGRPVNKKIKNFNSTGDYTEAINKRIEQIRRENSQLIGSSEETSRPALYALFIQSLANEADNNGGVFRLQVPRVVTTGHPWFSRSTNQGKRLGMRRLASFDKAVIKYMESKLQHLEQAFSDKSNRPMWVDREIEYWKKRIQFAKGSKSTRSFKETFPEVRIQSAYVYTTPGGTYGIDDEYVMGKKGVIFVTTDSMFDTSKESFGQRYVKLMQQYDKQMVDKGYSDLKEETGETVPSVMMVPVENLGLSIRDLANPLFNRGFLLGEEQTITLKDGTTIKRRTTMPIRTTQAGIRTYVGLWNFRANLLLFRRKVQEYANHHGLNLLKLLKYLEIDALIKGKKTVSIDNKEEFDSYIKHVDEINNSLNSTVKMFRLGGSYNGNGFHLLELDRDAVASKFYPNKKDRIMGLTIDLNTTNKFLTLLGGYDEDSKSTGLFSVYNLFITNNTDPFTVISLGKGNIDSLSGNLDAVLGDVEIINPLNGTSLMLLINPAMVRDADGAEHPYNLSKGVLNAFANILPVTLKVLEANDVIMEINSTNTELSIFEGHGFNIENLDDSQSHWQIVLTGDVTELNGEKKSFRKEIPYLYNIWNATSQFIGADNAPDYSLNDLLSLALHGTVEDIHHDGEASVLFYLDEKRATREDEEKIPRDYEGRRPLTGVPLPNGYMVDPMGSSDHSNDVKSSDGSMVWKKITTQESLLGVNGAVRSPLFYIPFGEMLQAYEDHRNPVKKSSININIDGQDLDIEVANTTFGSEDLKQQYAIIRSRTREKGKISTGDILGILDSSKPTIYTSFSKDGDNIKVTSLLLSIRELYNKNTGSTYNNIVNIFTDQNDVSLFIIETDTGTLFEILLKDGALKYKGIVEKSNEETQKNIEEKVDNSSVRSKLLATKEKQENSLDKETMQKYTKQFQELNTADRIVRGIAKDFIKLNKDYKDAGGVPVDALNTLLNKYKEEINSIEDPDLQSEVDKIISNIIDELTNYCNKS